MDLARFSIRNPVLVNLLTVFLIGLGAFIYSNVIRKEVFPEVEIGLIRVTTVDPGVSPADIEREITIPLENEIARVDGIDELSSTSSEGVSTIVVLLKSGVDPQRALLDVKAEADKADLPDGVDAPLVEEQTLPMSVVSVALYVTPDALEQARAASEPWQRAEDGLPFALERRLQEVADRLRDRLLQFPGIDSVPPVGDRERRLYVEADPGALMAHGLSLAGVSQALAAANTQTPGGRVDTGTDEVALRAGRLFADHPAGVVAAANETIVRVGDRGSGLPLSQVARVVDGFEDLRERARAWVPDPARDRGEAGVSMPAILMPVYKTEEADVIRLFDRLEGYLGEFEQSLPAGIGLQLYDDRSVLIRQRLETVETNGTIGLIIVIITLFFFLNYRMALMTALCIPVSLFGAMVALWAFGFSANMLSLFGLIIALGMVVDEGIIICENAYRYMEMGYSPVKAALKGTQEVFWPVVASVVTTMAAFLPLLLWSGVTGQFMAVIPVAVIAALAVSLVEAMIILPSHVADWSHDPRRPQTRTGRVLDASFRWTDPVRHAFQRGFNGFRQLYTWVLVRALRLRYLVVVLFMIAFMATMGLAGRTGTTFLDFKQIDRFYVTVELAEDATVEQTAEMLSAVEREIHAEIPYGAVAAITTEAGRYRDQNRVTTVARNVGQIEVELAELDVYEQVTGEAPASDYRVADNVMGIISRLRSRVAALPVESYSVWPRTGGPPEGSPIEIRLRGENHADLLVVANELRDRMKELRGVSDVASDATEGAAEYRFPIDEERVRDLGLEPAQITAAVRGAFDGYLATQITRNKDEIDVVVRLAPGDRDSRADVLDYRLVTSAGRVPLKDLVSGFVRTTGSSSINRFDQERSVLITAEVDSITPRQGAGMVRDLVDELLAGRTDIDVSYEGRFAAEQQGFRDLGAFSLIAAGLIFLILSGVLRSVVQPLIVMAAVPFAFIGVVIGLFLLGEKISVASMVGAVALIGIVVNDSTVLVDFINQQRRGGEGRWVALVRGSRLRLRPVLLTTLTTIAGLFTISYGAFFGVGGRETFLAPMGIAISWGLAFSTMLVLLLVPCLYAIYEDMLLALGIRREHTERAAREVDALVASGELQRLYAGRAAPSPDDPRAAVAAAVDPTAATPSRDGGAAAEPEKQHPTPVPAEEVPPSAQSRRTRRTRRFSRRHDTAAGLPIEPLADEAPPEDTDRRRSRRRKGPEPPSPDSYTI